MVSFRLTFQFLLALCAAIAAPAYFDNGGVYSRELSFLNFLEKRSVTGMLENQACTRGYGGGDVAHIARDISHLSIRSGSDSEDNQPLMGATNKAKLDWHMKQAAECEKAVERAKKAPTGKAAKKFVRTTDQQKRVAGNNLHTARESLEGHKEAIEWHKDQIAKGHP